MVSRSLFWTVISCTAIGLGVFGIVLIYFMIFNAYKVYHEYKRERAETACQSIRIEAELQPEGSHERKRSRSVRQHHQQEQPTDPSNTV